MRKSWLQRRRLMRGRMHLAAEKKYLYCRGISDATSQPRYFRLRHLNTLRIACHESIWDIAKIVECIDFWAVTVLSLGLETASPGSKQSDTTDSRSIVSNFKSVIRFSFVVTSECHAMAYRRVLPRTP